MYGFRAGRGFRVGRGGHSGPPVLFAADRFLLASLTIPFKTFPQAMLLTCSNVFLPLARSRIEATLSLQDKRILFLVLRGIVSNVKITSICIEPIKMHNMNLNLQLT
mgnify:CR=1 FL=1